ncbi:MAG: hypothetical protein MI924_21020 [Chloroflexales bacterium]|nr:hypothetical protein [Chloroflexales bacterium]
MARLVLDLALTTVAGKYFQLTREQPSSKEFYDRAKAHELWPASAELVQLTPDESIFSDAASCRPHHMPAHG